MSEDAIDLAQRIDKFAQPDDVAFAVELENTSDQPITLLDTRYGDSFGASSGKANSDWYGQFLFSIDVYDSDGKLVERPEVEVVTLNMILGSVGVAAVEPGKTHRFLLRPSNWLSLYRRNFEPGSYRVAVRYRGMPPRVVTRIKEYKPESPVFAAVAGDIVTPPVAFEVHSPPVAADGPKETEPIATVWGEPTNGLRTALSFAPAKASHAHGEKLQLNMHVENVSDKPITVASQLWMSDLAAQVKNDKGEPVQVGGTFYSGSTPVVRVTLKPRQIAVFGAGNIGLAITAEQAGNFEHITNRTLVAPAGKYTVQLGERFGKSFLMKDGQGKVLAPLPGDFVGEVKTGAAPLTITNETIDCSIIDADTGNEKDRTPIEKEIQFRLLGGGQEIPLPDVEVEMMNYRGSGRERVGLFRTDEAGTAQMALPPGSFRLQLKADKALPYLLVDMSGGLDPGDVHAFRIPFELGIGGDGTDKLVGRVIDARPGQTLQLRLRAHNGSNRIRAENEPPPESGNVMFTVAAAGDDAGEQAEDKATAIRAGNSAPDIPAENAPSELLSRMIEQPSVELLRQLLASAEIEYPAADRVAGRCAEPAGPQGEQQNQGDRHRCRTVRRC